MVFQTKSIMRYFFTFVFCMLATFARSAESPSNILLITADDLGYEALDFLDGGLAGVTPNLEKLASQSLGFKKAHVNVAICAPSRSVIGTGRYGHNSGLFGFNRLTEKIPTVFGSFQNNGFLTGVLGKVSHSTCDPDFVWDFVHDYGELGAGRSPSKYHDYAAEFFARSKKEGKPFYFMVNSHDPHRPFHNPERPMKSAEEPSRLFTPEEVPVPSYLTDLPEVRKELSHYYNSVRRLDDTVGHVLEALDQSGLTDNTLVVFITDNGSAFPFAKANAYLASTRTALLVRWPGVTKAGSVDAKHFVSEVDFFPTFLEVAGLPKPEGLDGRSLVPLFKGESQEDREYVFTQIDYTIGGPAKPMRCIQDERYAYIFNAFSDGKFKYRNNNEGLTFKAMEKAGKNDPAIQERVDMYRYRIPQEFYDLQKDPGCIINLIDEPAYQERIAQYQKRLRQWMLETNDHCITAFDVRDDPVKLAAAVKNYPKLVRVDKSVEKSKSGKTSDDEQKRKRREQRLKRKNAEKAKAK